MKSERLKFPGSRGAQLAAQIDRPDEGEARSCALFAHCFTCSKNLKAVVNIAKALTAEGIEVFRFDFTGLGESEGDFSETDFSSNIEDLIAAADFMKRQSEAPKMLIGHSLGGAAVIQAAGGIDSCQAVVTIAAPYDPEHVAHLFESKREEIEEKGEATVNLAGRRFRITKRFLDDLEREGLKDTLAQLRRALLIFHSPTDNTVGIDNAAKIFQAAKHPKSFISLHGADHLLTDEEDSKYVGNVIAHWATRYID